MAVESSVFVLEDPAKESALRRGLSAKEVHRRARQARRALGIAQGALQFWLLEIDERKLYQEFGCSSTFHNFARSTQVNTLRNCNAEK